MCFTSTAFYKKAPFLRQHLVSGFLALWQGLAFVALWTYVIKQQNKKNQHNQMNYKVTALVLTGHRRDQDTVVLPLPPQPSADLCSTSTLLRSVDATTRLHRPMVSKQTQHTCTNQPARSTSTLLRSVDATTGPLRLILERNSAHVYHTMHVPNFSRLKVR